MYLSDEILGESAATPISNCKIVVDNATAASRIDGLRHLGTLPIAPSVKQRHTYTYAAKGGLTAIVCVIRFEFGSREPDEPDKIVDPKTPLPLAEGIAHTLASTSSACSRPQIWSRLGIVMQARRCDDGARDLDLLLAKLRVQIVAFTATQADIARKAFRRYGRGRHEANLNFGDCFAYALAKNKSDALLFKGDDFGRTDVLVAPY
jgi:uncharacterized protein with PIN domain